MKLWFLTLKNRQKYIDVRNNVHYTNDRGVICMR